MKMDFNPYGAGLLALATVCLTVLIYTGKVPYAALAGLLGWLIPSPIGPKGPAPGLTVNIEPEPEKKP